MAENRNVRGNHINPKSVSTGRLANAIKDAAIQTAWDGLVVPVSEGMGMGEAIDPSKTTTPVSDALQKIADSDPPGVGGVLIPVEGIQEEGTISPPDGRRYSIIGVGNKTGRDGPPEASTIEFTSTGSTSDHGFELNEFNDDMLIRGINIVGPGETSTSGDGIHFTGHTRGLRMENCTVKNWGRNGMGVSSGKPYDGVFSGVSFFYNGGKHLDLQGWGPGNYFDMLRTEGGEMVIDHRGGHTVIGTLNVGGDLASGGGGPNNEAIRSHGGLDIQRINFEPTSFGGSRMFHHRFDLHSSRIGSVVNHATLDYIYELNNAGKAIVGPVNNVGTINNNVVNIGPSPPEGACWYYGDSTDVDNGAGGSTGLIRSLASAGTGNG